MVVIIGVLRVARSVLIVAIIMVRYGVSIIYPIAFIITARSVVIVVIVVIAAIIIARSLVIVVIMAMIIARSVVIVVIVAIITIRSAALMAIRIFGFDRFFDVLEEHLLKGRIRVLGCRLTTRHSTIFIHCWKI